MDGLGASAKRRRHIADCAGNRLVEQTQRRKRATVGTVRLPANNDVSWVVTVDCAVTDNEKGFSDIMDHLYQRHRRHFLFLAGPDDIWDAAARRRAVEAYARTHSDIILDIAAGDMTQEDGRRLTLRYLERCPALPHAIVASNDAITFGALDVLKTREIAFPQQVAVVGCDDGPAAALIGLSTLHMPMFELGQAAASLLLERLDCKTSQLPGRTRYLPMTLEVRQTSGEK